MTVPAARTGGSRPGAIPRLITPFALVVVGAFALCAGFGFTVALQSDSQHQDHQRAALADAIDEFRASFVELTARRADDLAYLARVSGGLSAKELARRLGSSSLPRTRHDSAFLVAAEGQVIVAAPDATEIPAGIAPLLARFRAELAINPQLVKEFTGRSDFAQIEGEPALIAAAFVRSIGSDAAPAALVRVLMLDERLATKFQKLSGTSGIAFNATAPGAGHEVRSLLDAQGRIVGWVSWETQRPMMAALARLGPLLAFVGACLVGFAGLSVRQITRATGRLARSEAQAQKLAYEDTITSLPNRRKVFEIFDATLGARSGDQTVSFAFVDLDGFKEINETLGHQCGDSLLAEVAERLTQTMPATATVGRLGADEFAIIMPGADWETAASHARAAVAAVGRPFWIGGQSVQIGASVGLVEAPRDGRTRDELTRRADHALRSVKRSGRGRVAGFDAKLEQEFNDRLFIKRELKRALAEESLDVHYQPIVAAEGSRIVGVEALVRWTHPVRGNIPPATFVPIAEQSGLMLDLGHFVLRRALSDAASWKDVWVAINLSPVQVRDRHLIELVSEEIRAAGIAPDRVVLEITEGVLIDNPDEASQKLEQLRELGCKIALDDFGSGYSNLSYLRKFPIDKLKIDREFVRPLGRSTDGGVIIQAIIALGRALGLSVLCEGVETEEQRILLRLAGCDEMQGFLFAKPAPRATIDRLLTPPRAAAPREAAS